MKDHKTANWGTGGASMIETRRTGGLGGTGWRRRGRGVSDRDQLT